MRRMKKKKKMMRMCRELPTDHPDPPSHRQSSQPPHRYTSDLWRRGCCCLCCTDNDSGRGLGRGWMEAYMTQ